MYTHGLYPHASGTSPFSLLLGPSDAQLVTEKRDGKARAHIAYARRATPRHRPRPHAKRDRGGQACRTSTHMRERCARSPNWGGSEPLRLLPSRCLQYHARRMKWPGHSWLMRICSCGTINGDSTRPRNFTDTWLAFREAFHTWLLCYCACAVFPVSLHPLPKYAKILQVLRKRCAAS